MTRKKAPPEPEHPCLVCGREVECVQIQEKKDGTEARLWFMHRGDPPDAPMCRAMVIGADAVRAMVAVLDAVSDAKHLVANDSETRH